MAVSAVIWLMAGVAKQADARRLVHARSHGPASGRRGSRRRLGWRGSVDEAGKAAQSGLGDLPQHQIVGRSPGVAAGLAGGFLAGQAQRALLVAIIDVPDPGDHGAAAVDLGGEIASYTVGGGA